MLHKRSNTRTDSADKQTDKQTSNWQTDTFLSTRSKAKTVIKNILGKVSQRSCYKAPMHTYIYLCVIFQAKLHSILAGNLCNKYSLKGSKNHANFIFEVEALDLFKNYILYICDFILCRTEFIVPFLCFLLKYELRLVVCQVGNFRI